MNNTDRTKFDYKNNIGFIINKTAKSLFQVLDQELRKNIGITCSQWKIIIVIINNDNGLTQKEIADKLGLEGPSLIHIIDKLENDGFLFRKVDTEDRRNNGIFLTEKSYSMLESMINCGLKVNNKLTEDIPQENISITKQTLEKMWQNIQSGFNQNLSIIEDNQRINNIQEIEFTTVNCDLNSTYLENRKQN